jgi:hypothetical protein
MNNTLRYHDAWKAYRKAVEAARDKYKRELKRLERYMDSKQGEKDAETAKATFEGELEAARAVARPAFKAAIDGMKEHVGKPDMKAPTPEMLSVLTMLDMRDSIDAAEVEAACRVMKDNSAALTTLSQVVMRHGAMMPIGFKTPHAQAVEAVERLQRAADNLMSWDGRSAMEISSDASKAYHDAKWAGGTFTGRERIAQGVADIEAQSTYRATVQRVIGDDVSMSVVDMLG